MPPTFSLVEVYGRKVREAKIFDGLSVPLNSLGLVQAEKWAIYLFESLRIFWN